MTISFKLRKLIYEKLSEGKYKDDIAKTYNISLRAVYNIAIQGIGRSPPPKHLRKSKKTKQLVSMVIKRLRKTKVHVSCSKIANKIDTALSKSTIRRQLVTLDYKYVPRISSIILSNLQKKLRVEIVRSYITHGLISTKSFLRMNHDFLWMEMIILKHGL